MTILWRAADDDVLSEGMSLAIRRDCAEAYLDGRNPGYGGAHLWSLAPTGVCLDATGWSAARLAAELGMADPCAIGLDEWIPRDSRITAALRVLGFLWIAVDESYPDTTTTWIYCGEEPLYLVRAEAAHGR